MDQSFWRASVLQRGKRKGLWYLLSPSSFLIQKKETVRTASFPSLWFWVAKRWLMGLSEHEQEVAPDTCKHTDHNGHLTDFCGETRAALITQAKWKCVTIHRCVIIPEANTQPKFGSRAEPQSGDPGLSVLHAHFKGVFALSSQTCIHRAPSEQIWCSQMNSKHKTLQFFQMEAQHCVMAWTAFRASTVS